jgi:hypothetical protein
MTWVKSTANFDTTHDTDVWSLCIFNGKVYAGVRNSGTDDYARVYESTDGLTWTLNHTFDDMSSVSDDSIVSIAVHNSKLYALRSYAGRSYLYEYNGSAWSLTIDLYTQYGAKFPTHLNVYGGKLFEAGSATAEHQYHDLRSAVNPSAGWSDDLHDDKQASIEKTIEYNGDLFALGAYANFIDGAYIYRCHNGLWDIGTQFVNSSSIYDATVYKNKLYVIGNDKSDNTMVYIYAYDGSSWTVAAHHTAATTYGLFIFARVGGVLYTNGPDTAVPIQYQFRTSIDGVDFSTIEVYTTSTTYDPRIATRTRINFLTKTIVGGGHGRLGGTQTIATYSYTSDTSSYSGVSSWNESDSVFALSNGPC